jgi:hypothetical protein
MRRTPVHLQRGIEPMEPQAHGRLATALPPAPRTGSAARGWPCPARRLQRDERAGGPGGAEWCGPPSCLYWRGWVRGAPREQGDAGCNLKTRVR